MSVKIQPKQPTNSVEVSLFDVYTTTYFLQAHTMLEEHKPAKREEADLDERL